MKQTHPGASAAKWKAYNAKYGMQARQIIEGFTMVAGAEDHVETNSTAPATRQRNVTKKKGPDVEDAGTPREVKRVPGMFTGAADWKCRELETWHDKHREWCQIPASALRCWSS